MKWTFWTNRIDTVTYTEYWKKGISEPVNICQRISVLANYFRDEIDHNIGIHSLDWRRGHIVPAPTIWDLKTNLFLKACKASPKNQMIIYLQAVSPSDFSLESYWRLSCLSCARISLTMVKRNFQSKNLYLKIIALSEILHLYLRK